MTQPAATPETPGPPTAGGDRLRVLLLAGRFEVRGSSSYTLRLARHLGGHDIIPQVICTDARQVAAAKRAQISLREYAHLTLPVWGRVVREWIRADLEPEPPDLIHVQSRHVLPQGAWLARRLKRPFVLTVHDFLNPRERMRIDRRWRRRVIAVSQSVRADLLDRTRLSGDFVTVVHSGVDVPDDAAGPVLEPDHVPVVGTAGPLEAVKGLPFFLDAARQVLAVRPEVEFLVAGGGPEEANLRRLARELGVAGRVTFIPNLDDFSTALAAMDIYCLPSLRQGLGTIMLEAMARGRPVIATGVGGVYSAVRDGQTGLVVPPRDSSALAARILELLDDAVRARALGDAARRMVRQEFSVDQMVARTAAVYREALRDGPRLEEESASRVDPTGRPG